MVAVGGVFGAIFRYILTLALPLPSFGIIFLINLLGSVLIGILYKDASVLLWPLLVIGFCGAFTTFSTYSLDNVTFLLNGEWGRMMIYVFSTNACCIGGCWMGFKLRLLFMG